MALSHMSAAGYDESEKTTDAILKLLKEKHPSFIAAIYGATDHAGHRFGPHSDEVREAVMGIDTAVAHLIKGLKELGLYDQTVIAFTADHGMSGYDEKPVSADPAKALEKAGFKVATSSKAVNDDTQIVMISAGVRMIWFRKNVSEKQKAVALNCLRKIKGTELLERAQLDDLGCHNNRSGDVILSPLLGYTITHAGDKGGQHGRFAERNPVMFFHGPGFAHGKTVAGARNIDVVPTLLHLAAVPPAATVEGKVISEALAQSHLPRDSQRRFDGHARAFEKPGTAHTFRIAFNRCTVAPIEHGITINPRFEAKMAKPSFPFEAKGMSAPLRTTPHHTSSHVDKTNYNHQLHSMSSIICL